MGIAVRLVASVVLSFSITITLSTCSSPIDGGSVTMTGTVYDSVTDLPIPEAWLAVSDSSPQFRFYADSAGEYEWVSWGIVNVTFFVGKEGYVTKEHFFESIGEDMAGVDFELSPTDSI